jgi:hypothetical protein
VGGEGAGGTQQRIDEGGLAVVDVGDERDVAKCSAHERCSLGDLEDAGGSA